MAEKKRIPPIYLEEIILLNEENNRLLQENKELKEKLWKINDISYLSVVEELHKGEEK